MAINQRADLSSSAAVGNATFERVNPLSGRVVSRAIAASVSDAVKIADTASAAFPKWAALGPGERRRLLLRAAEVLRSKADKFRELMEAETDVTGAYAEFNVRLGAALLDEAASLTTQITGEVVPSDKPGCLSLAVRQPVGVCLAIAPWNAPVILAVRSIAMPLACGNTVILKGSELSPATHSLLGEVFREAGFAEGVVNVVTNAPADAVAVGEALIGHPAVKRINFTGSSKVGKLVAQTAAKYLKPVLLELGGKSPLIVLDDADIDGAVNAAIFAGFIFQGQVCMSTERIIVHEKIADTFIDKLSKRARTLKAGTSREGASLGSLIDVKSAERVEGLIQDALSKGAKLLSGGGRNGSTIEPTLLADVTTDMRIYQEESFGPAKAVFRVKDDEAAIELANDTEYGLSAAIFSQDIRRALAMANRLQTGKCHINGPTVQDEAHAPFGGLKDSGYGRFGGKFSIGEFTDLRWITIEDPKQSYPF